MIAAAICLVLVPIAGLHVYWAFGGLWPADTPKTLVNTVIGGNNLVQMPGRLLTLSVASMIFAAGIMPLVNLWGVLPDFLTRPALWLLAAVFFGRGIVTYLLPGLAAKAAEPFRTLNRRYFSPLCLALAAGVLAILLGY